jgi:hypothetical protein
MASRMVQPYRKGSRNPSPALTAMLRGRSFSGGNPQDQVRAVQRLIRAGKGKQHRPARPVRPERPARPQ